MSAAAFATALFVGAMFWAGRGDLPSSEPPSSPDAWFRDVAEQTGLTFTHFNGMSGELYFVETVGSGAALFDYDNDGDLDVYLVQGAMLGERDLSQATFPWTLPQPPKDRLFRNQWVESGVLKFEDVSEEAGVDVVSYGMGVAVGDFDNDGWPDLYLTSFGDNRLLRNLGDGRFEDVTARAGVNDSRWSTAASFVDVDQDGLLDLYVCNYVEFSITTHKPCAGKQGVRDYCGPRSYEPEPDRLFRNLGDGRFEDISLKSGVTSEFGACLGVLQADFNGDHNVDIYVANDGAMNQMWMGMGDGTFRNEALFAGTGLNGNGQAEASMGIDAGDFDNDGDLDLILAHLNGETNTLYENRGDGLFEDASMLVGLASPSLEFTAFGTVWVDFDNDGWLDVFMANGEVRQIEALALAGDIYPLHQRNQLFRSHEAHGFEDVSRQAGAVMALSEVSRGVAVGDIDNDGDADLLVTNNAAPVRLLLNEIATGSAWIGFSVRDVNQGRDVLGAQLELTLPDGTKRWRHVRVSSSYLSSNDPRVLVGLGQSHGPVAVRVHWPDGKVEDLGKRESGRYYAISRE